MSNKAWRFLLVWTWAFCIFAVYNIAIEKSPVWFHIVCGAMQLAGFLLSAVIVTMAAKHESRQRR